MHAVLCTVHQYTLIFPCALGCASLLFWWCSQASECKKVYAAQNAALREQSLDAVCMVLLSVAGPEAPHSVAAAVDPSRTQVRSVIHS